MYLLDSNIIIYVVNGKYPQLFERIKENEPGNIAIPSIVVSEIEYGAQKSSNYKELIKKYLFFYSPFRIVPFTAKAAYYSGKIRSDLEKKGTPIGMYDTLIAGTALAEDGILVTHNVKEFERVEGLKVEDWTE